LRSGIVVFAFLINFLLPDIRESKPDAGLLNFHLAAAAMFLILAIFSYTNLIHKGVQPGFRIVSLFCRDNLSAGSGPDDFRVAVIELVMLAWMAFVLPPEERSVWIPIQAASTWCYNRPFFGLCLAEIASAPSYRSDGRFS
jgi:hypothetical protein